MPSRFLGEILPVGGTYGMGFVFNVQLTVFGFVLLRYYCIIVLWLGTIVTLSRSLT